MKTDRSGNYIGDGSSHTSYFVHEDIPYTVILSDNSESVYVRYYSGDKSITVRFSNHENNAVKFGDQLNGRLATKDEILFHLGLKKRTFIPNTYLSISSRMVKKIEVCKYEEAELTIKEMYDLGAGADLSPFKGKLAKGGNRLILGDKVEEVVETRTNVFGQSVQMGEFIYHD